MDGRVVEEVLDRPGDAVALRLAGDHDRVVAEELLDQRLVAAAERLALQVDLDSLLDVHSDDDVVIRPVPSSSGERTTWMLSRPTGKTIAVKIRLEPTD